MASDPNIDNEDDYASSADSDFAPDAAPEPASDASDSEDNADDGAATGKRKLPKADSNADEAGYENSGDEAIIEKGKKRQKRAKTKAGKVADDDDEGGEGGLVKTRRQRAAEKEERKYAANNEPITIDVDAVWAQMMAGGPGNTAPQTTATLEDATARTADDEPIDSAIDTQDSNTERDLPAMIKIKRTYNFAGRVHTEEKLVPRDSAEAKLYLSSQDPNSAPLDSTTTSPPKRLTKKAFRSAFEPVVEVSATDRTDLVLGITARMKAASEAQAKKLNTVEKSRMDWAGYVDKEGIKDELELAGKSKHSYTARQDFLARSEAFRDGEARKVRLAGRL